MRRRLTRVSFVSLYFLCAVVASCSRDGAGGLIRQYEYEEEVFLDLDGSATMIVNASIPALVALRGLDLDPDPHTRVDRDRIRQLYQSDVASVTRVSRPWRRSGRRFVQVRLRVEDIRRLPKAPPFGWARYELQTTADRVTYRQIVGSAADRKVSDVGWTGRELVAFRLHLPSRILYHNARQLTGETREVERGNILTWEQRFSDRLAGSSVDVTVRMEPQSILYRTLWLFALAFAAAVAVLALLIWSMMRKGREPAASPSAGGR